MSTFPGSNLNVISGIDPVGAGFLGGEVNRLQEDTSNKRNNATARRGQDQEMQVSQQQMQQQAAQQQAQMAQQQAQFEKEQEAAQTENALNRSFQTDILSYQHERADNQRMYEAAVAAGDEAAMEETKARMLAIGQKLKERNKKAGALSILLNYQKGLTSPDKDGNVKAIDDTLKAISERDTHQFTYLTSINDAVREGLATADAELSERAKVLEGIRTGGMAKVISTAAGVTDPGEGNFLGRVRDAVAAKVAGWFDDLVPGGIVQEATPEQKVGQAVVHVARSLSGVLKVEGRSSTEVEGMLVRFLKAGHAAATGPAEGREAAIKAVATEKAAMKASGMTDAMIKTVMGSLEVATSARESQRMMEKVGAGPGGNGVVKDDGPGDTRRKLTNTAYTRMVHALEEGTGLSVDHSSFILGKDGVAKYTGADLSRAELGSIFIDWMDGELSDDENKKVFERLGDRGEDLKKIIEPQIKMYLDRAVQIAKENDLPLDEVVERMGGPGFLTKFKNVAALYGVTTEEASGLATEQSGIELDALTKDKQFKLDQAKRWAERNKEARGRFDALYNADKKRESDRQKGLR